jgi:hypothetical protein
VTLSGSTKRAESLIRSIPIPLADESPGRVFHELARSERAPAGSLRSNGRPLTSRRRIKNEWVGNGKGKMNVRK